MKAPFVAVSLVFLVSCGGDTDQTVCDLAVQHVSACLNQSVDTQAAVCSADAASQAQNVLRMSCSDVAGGERSTMVVDDLVCKLLPFVCQLGDKLGFGASGKTRRINQCWHDPHHGWCVDVVKIGNGCTKLMDQHEWLSGQNPWTHAECRDMRHNGCRLARVCFGNNDMDKCNHVQHHSDQPQICSDNQWGWGEHHNGDFRRISDCWHNPHHGWCYDAIKLDGGCSRLMDHHEWAGQHGYSHAECRENHGGGCRVVRLCRDNISHKSQCLGDSHHHHDVPMCHNNLP
jgi:hypothetical protein